MYGYTATKGNEMMFNEDLIEGLFKIRNRGYSGIRQWLRECVRIERERRGR